MPEPRRLLMVTHFFASHGGGIERVAGHLSRALAAAGHALGWSASSSDPAPDDAGVTALPLPCVNPTERLTGLPMPVPTPRGLAMLARAARAADAVIVHDALYVTSIAALIAARRAGRPVVLVQHIAELDFANPVMRAIMRTAAALVVRPMLRAADQVVFISAAVRDAFAEVPMRRAPELLFNGVDTATFHPVPAEGEGERVRRELELPVTGPLVTFVGRFVAKKGLAVVRECAARRPDLTFVLAGGGPIDPRRWGLANVHVVGPLAPAGVAALLRQSAMLLLPSLGEGYPLVVQEAMACGLPVICGEDSAAADPGAARFLRAVPVRHADPAGTAARIVPLLDRPRDPALGAEMARYAAETYNWEAMARRLVEAIPAA